MAITYYKGQVLPDKFQENIMTDKNSLVANLNKMPAISKRVIDLYDQHILTWLTEKTSRFAKEEIRDQAFRWKVRGQLTKPAYTNGKVYAADGTTQLDASAISAMSTDDIFHAEVKHDPANAIWGTELNPNDLVRLQSGATAIVLGYPAPGNNVAKYKFKFVGGDAVEADFSDNNVIGFIGSAFGEGSLGGYMNNQYSDWYINYTTINRKAAKITATAATNIEWITDGQNYAMWYFEQEGVNDKIFFRGLELQRRYAQSSMDNQTGNEIMGGSGTNKLSLAGFNDNNGGISAPQIGAGLYAQFEDANNHSYDISTGLEKDQLQEFIAILAQKAIGGGTKKHEWLVLAGTIGQMEFQKVMEGLVISPSAGGSYTDLATGRDMALGTNFTTYYYLGHKITLVYDETLDDPAIHASQNGLTGRGDLIFLDFSSKGGESNIELKTVYQRSFRKKYINGMHSFNGTNEAYAVSGYDGAGMETIAESGMVLRIPQSCGMISQSGTRASAWS